MTTNCEVCIEKYNKRNRKEIVCQNCNYSACQMCYKQTILNSKKTAGCMNCNAEFDDQFMASNFTKTFITNEYKKHLQEILWETEKILLPATQSIVEKMNYQKRIKEEIKDLNKQIVEINCRIGKLKIDFDNPPKNNMSFIKRCENSNCVGYLNENWQCGICKTNVCSHCYEIIEERQTHKCDQSIKESIELISKDSKTCPGCSVVIYKINGCDQIYCTNCKTVFSWKSGKIEKGAIHNPHFFEEMHERHILDIVQCGREIDAQFVESFRELYKKIKMDFFPVKTMFDSILYIQRRVLPSYYHRSFNNNQDLRIRFLQKKITEEEFKKKLLSRKQKTAMNKEISNILHTFITVMTDLFYRLENNLIMFTEQIENRHLVSVTHDNFYDQVDNFLAYINSCFQKIASKYNNKTHHQFTNIYLTFI